MSEQGLFCVLEGIDGSGKSSLCEQITNHYKYRSFAISAFAEPTKFPTGKKIRKVLSGELEMSSKELLELFLEDRKESLEKNIYPSLQKDKLTIADRYLYSTCAYQGISFFSPLEIFKMNLERGFRLPDIVFYLEIDLQTAFERRKDRLGQEILETESIQAKVLRNYEILFRENKLQENVFILDGKKTIPDLLKQSVSILDRFLD